MTSLLFLCELVEEGLYDTCCVFQGFVDVVVMLVTS